jgi:hypothetical protein
MSDEAPDTFDGAIRAFIGALGFIVALIGAEMMAEKDGVRFWLGLVLVLASLPVFLSVALWRSVRDRLSIRVLSDLNFVAKDGRWWIAAILVLLLVLALGGSDNPVIFKIYGGILVAGFATVFVLFRRARSDDVFYPPRVALTPYSTDKIYIGNIFADNPLGQLQKNRYIEFTVRIFNGNDVEFSLAGISGAVQCRQIGDQPHNFQPLDFSDTPVLKPSNLKSLPAFRETSLTIWQHVPANIADNILKSLNQPREVQFDFEKLDIELQAPASKTSIRLPLWDGVQVGRNFRTRRVHNATIREAVSAKDSS